LGGELERTAKSPQAKLRYIGHALMGNRHGLFVDAELTRVSGPAECLAAPDMIGATLERYMP
jgi:hypothetical protein